MKFRLIAIFASLTLFVQLSAQQKCMLVKFSGDTLYYDEITAAGKTVTCKNKGQDKVKHNASDVSYWVKPTKMLMQYEGEKKAHDVDTTIKFIFSDNKLFIVQIENDSLYLVESTQIGSETGAMDFHIFRKKNNEEVLEIRKDKSALETLKKYFGGTCDVFDKKITELRPKFQKAVFPYNEWYTLLYVFNNNCRK